MSLGFVGHILGTGLGMVWCLLNFDVKRCLFFFGFVGLPPPLWLKSEKGSKCIQKRRKDSLGENFSRQLKKNEKRVAWKAFSLIFQGSR